MSRYLLDTDTFSLFLQNNVNVVRAVLRHLSHHVAVSIITVQEVWDGWAAVVSGQRPRIKWRPRTPA